MEVYHERWMALLFYIIGSSLSGLAGYFSGYPALPAVAIAGASAGALILILRLVFASE